MSATSQWTRRHGRSLRGLGTLLAMLGLLLLPASGRAELADDIVAAFESALNDLVGDELDLSVHMSFSPPLSPPVNLEMTLVGFAMCSPTDPWMDPVVASPPLGIYECQNVSTCNVILTSGGSEAMLTFTVADLFLDLESARDETPYCMEMPPGTVIEPGYVIGDATLSMMAALTWTGTCYEAALVPGSVGVGIVVKARDSHDDCLMGLWSVVEPLALPLVEDALSTGIEELVVSMMDTINEALCLATPDERASWGDIKSRYRTDP